MVVLRLLREAPESATNCRAEYVPPTEDHYLALSQPDIPLDLPRVRRDPRLPLVQDAL